MKVKVATLIIFILSLSYLPNIYTAEQNQAGNSDNTQANTTENINQSNETEQSENSEEEDINKINIMFGGSIDTRIYTMHEVINKKMTIGSYNEIRLKADVRYKSLFRVYVEPMFLGYYGNRNNVYLLSKYGVLTQNQIDLSQNLVALGMNKNETVKLDRGWAQIALDWFRIRAGKQIIAWARAYAFNPTDKVNFPNLLDPEALNPGIMAVSYEFKIAEDIIKNRSLFVIGYFILTNSDAKDTPFAIKAKFNVKDFECAFSYIYEVKDDPFSPTGKKRKSYLGTDFFIQFLGISLYFEGTYRFEQKEDRNFNNQLIFVTGISTTFSFKMSLRIEYIRYGPGAADYKNYDLDRARAMLKPFMARNYVFIIIDGDVNQILWLGLSSFINLNDYSFMIIPQIKLSVIENVKVELGAYIFFGKEGDEFYGRYYVLDYSQTIPAYKLVDLTETTFYIKMKISF